MKHKRRLLSCFMALTMGLSLIPSSGLISVSDVMTVSAATVYTENKTGTEDGYDFELWKDRGNTKMTLLGNGSFSCEWNNINNCLFRTGKKLGSTKKFQDYNGISIDYDVDYNPNGNSYMCVYGWTENPTVEYYIVETWGSWRPPGNEQRLGTVTVDGGTYDIYKTMRYEQPSIHGTETFAQYWSVRQQKPSANGSNIKGTISVSKHFEAWEKAGLQMGDMYEVALNIEGYQSSGSATVNKNVLTFGGGSGGNGGNSSTTPPASSQPQISGSAPSGSGTGVSDDFEGSGTTWAPRGDSVELLLTGDAKHGGSKSLAVTGRSASWNGIMASSSELKAGGSYSFSSYVTYKNENYTTSGFEFGVQYDLDGTTNYDNIGDASTSSGKWAELSGDFKIPAGAENISLYVQSTYSENDTAADLLDFFIDDVKLTGGSSSSNNNNNTGNNTPVSSDSLKDKFANCFKIGTSVSPHELGSGASFIKKHFNSITPENELKPEAIINQQASQQYGNNVDTQISFSSGAQQTMKFCEENGIPMRGHTFVWYSQTPDWFFRENFSANGNYVSKDIMDKRMESMIKNTFAAIKKQFPNLEVYSYDVCNELFLNDGGGLRPASNSNWTKIYGDDSFAIKAFEYARKYAPEGCKLYLNDYNEYIPAKTDDIYNLAMKLKEKGLIDGIGMQSHLDVSYPSAQVYKTALEKFLSTGLEVQITELDITCGSDSAQAALFKDIFELAVKHADQIPALTVWGTHDSISWRSSQNPLLFGSGYTPKSAYTSVMSIDVPTGGNNNQGNTTPSVTNPPAQTQPPASSTPSGSSNPSSPKEYMAEAKANFTSNVPSDVKNGDKGKTEKITYYSKKAQRNKPANVWLPPNYSKDKKYPVVYMNHGIMGGEDDLLTGWSIREMASNLIEKGEVQPFIIVFTQMYTDPNAERPSGITQEATDRYDDFLYDLTESLMPYMSQNYSIAEGRENTAIAGFSMGGRESLYIGMMAADKIGYVCASSPAPGIVPAQDMYLNHRGSMTESEFKFSEPYLPYLLMIGGGTADGVVGTFPKQYHELYEKNGTDHIWFEVQGGGHDASVGTPLFYNFFRNLFKASGSGSGSVTPSVTTPSSPSTTPSNSQTTKPTKGDVDGNGSVTSTDLIKLLQAVVGKSSLSSQQKSNADMNGDGKLSIIDVIKLKNMLM